MLKMPNKQQNNAPKSIPYSPNFSYKIKEVFPNYHILDGPPCEPNDISLDVPTFQTSVDFNKMTNRPPVEKKGAEKFEPVYSIPKVSSNIKHMANYPMSKSPPRPDFFNLTNVSDVCGTSCKDVIMTKTEYSK